MIKLTKLIHISLEINRVIARISFLIYNQNENHILCVLSRCAKQIQTKQRKIKMAMTWMRRFYSKIKGKKVKELPAYIKSTYSMESVKTYVMKGLDNYNDKYIQTSSVDPLLHICFGGMAFSYLLAIPHEKCFFEEKYAKEAKKLAKEKLAKEQLCNIPSCDM
ncbi:uncharacterized protein LOC103855052 [Brassica rapa]|uniref:uncharacterized protein LOC103855052 n=1 Tax=Brassica campestris TaxID=3711 RepID=UPI00142E2D2D|nr:uncharacterized protein LOC103855052 [Brassica rapa]